MTQPRSLRERLMVRNGYKPEGQEEIQLPDSGRIDETTEARIQELALLATEGDLAARDTLYSAFRLRLNRMGYILTPTPNTPMMIGIWDRGDVRQESWLIFMELLQAWNGESRFVAYLLSRFKFRLRDRILRGIGKPQMQLGATRVSEATAAGSLPADVSEQPESAAMAKCLLEEIMRQHMLGGDSSEDEESWAEVANSTSEQQLLSPDQACDSTKPVRLNETA